jgi:hypothetical protein
MADQAAIKMFRDKFAGIRKAIKYLDTCGEFTFEKMVEANRVSQGGMARSQLQSLWEQGIGHPDGSEHVRREIRTALEGTMQELTGIAAQMGISQSQLAPSGCAGAAVLLLAVGLAGSVIALASVM